MYVGNPFAVLPISVSSFFHPLNMDLAMWLGLTNETLVNMTCKMFVGSRSFLTLGGCPKMACWIMRDLWPSNPEDSLPTVTHMRVAILDHPATIWSTSWPEIWKANTEQKNHPANPYNSGINKQVLFFFLKWNTEFWDGLLSLADIN